MHECRNRDEHGERTEIVIPKERSVFRMDGRGRWHNAHGRFRKKSIIDHFNRSIRKDASGYYVTQVNGDRIEKVYFPYEDTALFVAEVLFPGSEMDARIPTCSDDVVRLVLNTGAKLPLNPDALFVHHDNLYMQMGDERIRFGERSLLALANRIEGDDDAYFLRIGKVRYPIGKKRCL